MGRAGAGATTVIRAQGVLAGILADAVKKAKRLVANPCKGIDNLPRRTGKRHVYLCAEDVHRLADESGEHRALVLGVGLHRHPVGRSGGAQGGDVEFLRRRLRVSANAVQLGVSHALGPTKGRKAGQCQSPSSCSMSCRSSAKGRPLRISSSPAMAAAICRAQSRPMDGSRER